MSNLYLIGDSVIARQDSNGVQALVSRLESALPNDTLVLKAYSGANSDQIKNDMAGFVPVQDSKFILSLGMNDSAPWKSVPIDTFVENYLNILKYVDIQRAILIIPYPVDRHLQQKPGRDNTVIHGYAEAVKALANTQKITYIDLWEIIGTEMKSHTLHVDDGVHLNERGYSLFFEEAYKFIVTI